MKKDLTFLGIETSCDETAAAVVREDSDGNVKILSNVVSSQVDEHLEFGGVVPENAARSHAEKIDIIIKKAIEDSKCEFTKLDGVAATAGPGLLVCLMVGLSAGKSIAGILKKPFLAINHLEGHALTPRIFDKIEFPYLLLLVSGGHTQFLIVDGIGKYKRIGTTIDDALGDEVRITVVAAGFEGGEPKKVATPVINAATLGGVADPIASNDPISVALDLGSETPKRRVTFEELVAEDEIDVPDFMK